ncbi:hypothetical protein L21SP3_02248 [Sedimentisphaera cyanobacteriorum]|uniref:Uncharacterized protein n=1 Tax=Sedimentisphaera cyanobacteriorum TaxID=1940790 RepID=A0A1Q2HSZ5_9BACT|nr:hypothetical protein [Sedimentisphaera cyanobacteriorum]AQQ10416.1 hypothetical protein L21SP3_02248 [Sedimentisphaera cyanobacteriorum]
MKNCFFALLAVAAVAMAGSVTFDAVDNGDGTATISYTADAAVVGFALDVDSDVSVTDVTIPSFFDVFMDYANEEGESYVYGEGSPIAYQDAAGTNALPCVSFCISAGGLEDDETDVPSTSGDIVVTTGGAATVTLGENALRGGVVDYDGAMDTNLPITFDITDGGGEPICYGDIWDGGEGAPGSDGQIDTADMNYLMQQLGMAGAPYVIADPAAQGIEAADMWDGSNGEPGQDGQVDTADMNYMMQQLGMAGAPYVIPCE